MKNFLMDLCLVLLFICVIGLFFDDYQISKTMFQRSIDEFEQQVELEKPIESQYVTLQDTKDNSVSHVLKIISDGCVEVISFIVLFFSNFISMIFSVMVY